MESIFTRRIAPLPNRAALTMNCPERLEGRPQWAARGSQSHLVRHDPSKVEARHQANIGTSFDQKLSANQLLVMLVTT